MFWIKANAKPKAGTEEADLYGGAFVNFFIDFKDIGSCFILAENLIETETWEIQDISDEYYSIESETSGQF